MLYDCIIVGGGPAGVICSFILQSRGFSCVLLEKRTTIDEKICGGFIPDRCRNLMLHSGIDLTEMDTPSKHIKGYVETRFGKENYFSYKSDKYGLGVYRKNLDSFLLKKTEEVGTAVIYGETVRDYEKIKSVFHVNGFEGKYLILATGAKPPVQIAFFDQSKVHEIAQSQSIGISEIISVAGGKLDNNYVYFWYEENGDDYFWAIPIGEDTWNIGYWSQMGRRTIKEKFITGKKRWIEHNCSGIKSLRSPRGALLGNADFSKCLKDENVFCCGDIKGTNNLYTGEGIAQAVQSAQDTASIVATLLNGGK